MQARQNQKLPPSDNDMMVREGLPLRLHVDETWNYIAGMFSINFSENVSSSFDDDVELRIISSEQETEIHLYQIDAKDEDNFHSATCCMSLEFFESLQESNCFKLVCSAKKTFQRTLVVNVLLSDTIFLKLDQAQEFITFLPKKNVVSVFQHLRRNVFVDFSEFQPEDIYIDQLYNWMSTEQKKWVTGNKMRECQHEYLIPKLRTYQNEAVTWMLNREVVRADTGDLHPLFQEFETLDGKVVYAHKAGGFFVKEKFLATAIPSGGILADEMGLGKTVEVLALVLLHPKPECPLEVKPLSNSFERNDDPTHTESRHNRSTRNIPKSVRGSRGSKRFAAENPNFICLCGKAKSSPNNEITCTCCGLSQHLDCVSNVYETWPEHYVCPYCAVKETVSSRATLIVSPSSICFQWYEEIEKHAHPNVLKVLHYRGIKADKFIPPAVLADNDIVLVSYETFRSEIRFVSVNHAKASDMRTNKRYATLPTPLPSVTWWRICLDEAQMVESSTAKAAEMALRLKAYNHWCITGTPVQKTVGDLYGVFLFLKYEPYMEKKWFHELLYKPFSCGSIMNFASVLKPIFWRTQKKDVQDQIGLKPQLNMDYMLKFSSVENFFYEQQHQVCSSELSGKIKGLDTSLPLKYLNKKTFCQIMTPLKKLRQACCHPQAVKGQFTPLSKSIMSMTEISEALIKKTEHECQENHRCYVSSLNGLAGISLLENDIDSALISYVEVLKSVVYYLDNFKTDSLQQIHTLHNLVDVLRERGIQWELRLREGKNVFVMTLLNEEELELPSEYSGLEDMDEKEKALVEAYLLKHQESLKTAEGELSTRLDAVEKIKSTVMSQGSGNKIWYQHALDYVQSCDKGDLLVEKITTMVQLSKNKSMPALLSSFSDINGLSYVCYTLFTELIEARDSLCNTLQSLTAHPNEMDIISARNCHLSSESKNLHKCKYCKAEDVFRTYECKLFNTCKEKNNRRKKTQSEDDPSNKFSDVKMIGTWADGAIEQVLKCLLSFIPTKKVPTDLSKAGSEMMELFDSMKKEFKAYRTYWSQIRDYVSALDELRMAKSRFRCHSEDETLDPVTAATRDIIQWSRIPVYRQQFVFENAHFKGCVDECVGRLLFLKNVMQAYNRDPTADLCPICFASFESKWAAMRCGHRVCATCLHSLVKVAFREQEVKCPLCRVWTHTSDILFLNFQRENDEATAVKGNYSTKVSAVLRCLMDIRNKDEEAKSIVFSSFETVLVIIREALKENEMTFIDLIEKKNYKTKLRQFKMDKSFNILLLPIQYGANGLNIIEATNVLLVEPVLNPAVAEQAISRVHRIGQTKQTTIHRFYVESTIEEKIRNRSSADSIQTRYGVGGQMTIENMKTFFRLSS